MLRNKMKKLLAIILIFTLTYTHFALVTEAYAASFTEALLGIKSNSGDENVEFDAYFKAEDEKVSSVISDVNNQDLAIGINLGVEKNGYLKDAEINILCTKDEEKVNFNLKNLEELPKYVQSVEDNTLTLQQVDDSLDEIALEIPIEFNNEKYFNEKDLSKDFLVVLKGTYVTSDGEEDIRKEVPLKLSWKDENREIKIDTQTEKYIDFGSGVIIQSKLFVSNETELNTLPVKETQIKVDVPKYLGVTPSNVSVLAKSTMGTNGEPVGEVNPDNIAWEYKNEDGQLIINVANKEQKVKINAYEDEFLQDQDKELIEENRLYSLSGTDEYVITYTYNNVESSDELVNIESNIEVAQEIFSGENTSTLISNSYKYEDSLIEKIGEIASISIDNKTEDISKAYFYANIKGNSYDIDIDSIATVNISYKDIVNSLEIEDKGSTYISNDGKVFASSDAMYREVSIDRDNFIDILGENGEIKVYDISDLETPIASINKDENLVLDFTNDYSRLVLKTSRPVSEGNLSINIKKVIREVRVDKNTITSVNSVSTNLVMRANYDFVENGVDIKEVETRVNLINTETNAELMLQKDYLSTLANNEDFLVRIALNNATVESDLYGHSEFEIKFPENVEELSNVSANMVLENEILSITSVEADGNTIRIIVDGDQKEVRTGGIENGTIIDIRASVKVDPFTPVKSDVIKLEYNNSEATGYRNEGTSEATISYSAPSGFIVANSTYNYNEAGNRIVSVNQGKQVDLIDVYASARNATMELVVMNNNSNNVSDIAILGRFPYKGVKSILGDDELGTTIDPIISVIRSNNNNVDFNIYYSNNENATKDYNNEENGWSTELDSQNAKSYLIVPADPNYIMEPYSVLRFEYNYEIPENLPHNESIYGTFAAYYTNMVESTASREEKEADLIGITTGVGPEISIKASSNKAEVREHEELLVNIEFANVGKYKAEDVNIEMPIPENAQYSSFRNENNRIEIKPEEQVVRAHIDVLEQNEKMEFTIALKANEIEDILAKYNLEEVDEIEITEEELNKETFIEPTVSITAKDLGTTLEAKTEPVKILKAELEIEIKNMSRVDSGILVHKPGEQFRFSIDVRNLTENTINNVLVTQQLPKEYKFIKGVVCEYNGEETIENEIAQYDDSNRTVTWRIDSIRELGSIELRIYVETNELENGITKATVYTSVKVKSDETNEYESNSEAVELGKPVIRIVQTSSNVGDYVKEGDSLTYSFEVTNEGGARANAVKLTDVIPEGVNARKISYNANGLLSSKSVSSNEDAVLIIDVDPGEELEVDVDTVVSSLKGAKEKTITNYANASSEGVSDVESNKVTHIVEPRVASEVVTPTTTEKSSSGRVKTAASGTTSSSVISNTYKITGQAWLDENRDGIRNNNEQNISGITARLVNNDTGNIIRTVITDSTGAYTFSGVENGNYIVLFDYDTVKYSVTTYQKDGVATNVNSDFVTTKVEQDGKTRNAAISNVVKVLNGSVSGIDIGLVLADVFDLKIDKTITKVTVQTASNGTNTESYDHTKFIKTEIAAKQLVGSTVYVEYEIKVTNNGDIAGYAKKIADYVPSGMTFNSTLGNNSIWYTSSDGKLITEELANKQLAKGESATVKLILTRQMTTENTDIVSNLAEIYEDYNIYGVSDVNSTPANKAQNENDLSNADIAIMVKTGETFINISIIAMTILLMVIVAVVVNGKVKEILRRKGGV